MELERELRSMPDPKDIRDLETEAGLQAQVRDLQAAGCTKIFQEQVSSIAERAELERALDYVRGGDTLVVTKVDRLARSTVGLWEIVKRLEAVEDHGAGLRVLNLGGETVDTKSATGDRRLSRGRLARLGV